MNVIGVDVGSGSVRCSVICIDNGEVIHTEVESITIWNEIKDFYEQSSSEIWTKTCIAIKNCIQACPNTPISACGFSATCSLVVVGEDNEILSISPGKPSSRDRDIIMWMDHRAVKQKERIDNTNHPSLNHVGGKISAEMEPPKLLWLKEELPEVFNKAKYFMDLADFLSFKATGNCARSICTVTCKWMYDGSWDPTFWESIGLSELTNNNYQQIGEPESILQVGESAGTVTKEFSDATGLSIDTIVAGGMIDAHAGTIGLLSMKSDSCNINIGENVFSRRIAILGGTSACHMALCKSKTIVPGVWGPYSSAILPNMVLHEAGQSACGSLLDFVVENHPGYENIKQEIEDKGFSKYDILNDKIKIFSHNQFTCSLTKNIHVLPYFHGNRSPYANPDLKGMICGLTLSKSVEDLVLLYYSTIQSLCYETKQIISHLEEHNSEYNFDTICFSGGLSANEIFIQELADITQCNILVSQSQAMLLGSSMVAGTALGYFTSIEESMKSIVPVGKLITPSTDDFVKNYHSKKQKVFSIMYKHQLEYDAVMNE